MKKILLVSTLLFNFLCTAQTFEWAIPIGSIADDMVNAVTTDINGNVYTIGVFKNEVDFDPGIGEHLITATSSTPLSGNSDLFIQKLNPNGEFIWAKSIGNIGYSQYGSITVDEQENVYFCADFKGTVDVDPGPNNFNLTSNGNTDILVEKLDINGNLLWAKSFGGNEKDVSNKILLDEQNNIYFSGTYKDTIDFDPNSNISESISQGGMDSFIEKLDENGNFIWVYKLESSENILINSFSMNQFGEICLIGSFLDLVDFDPSANSETLTSSGSTDVFILKIDTSSNFIWVNKIGGPQPVFPRDIEFNNNGDIYSVGLFIGNVDFDPGIGTENTNSNGGLSFIQKLNADGEFIWVKTFGPNAFIKRITIDNYGNLYSLGVFYSDNDFDPSIGVTNLTNESGKDIFIQVLNENGELLWVKSIPCSVPNGATSITIDNNNDLYITGRFQGTIDFDPTSGIYNMTDEYMNQGGTLSSNMYITDGFILKLNSISLNLEKVATKPITVFPNPSKGKITIEIPKNLMAIDLEIINYSSQILFESKLNSTTNKIDLSHLTSGIYIASITLNSGEILNTKLVIEK